jgi:hypothetical protein
MSLNRPEPVSSLPATLYSIAAHTGIVLDAERLQHVLIGAREDGGAPIAASITLELRIDVTSRDGIKLAAAQVREIADLIAAAADKARSSADSR